MLPPGPARHVQVLRLQPGDAVTLFDGRGGEHEASITRMGRSEVEVRVGAFHPVEREATVQVHLALGIPANERMDWLVEKATELGVASITPLVTARSVLRVSGERIEKKRAHWQAVAIAACEQCGRNRVPDVALPQGFSAWLGTAAADAGSLRCVLSLLQDAQALQAFQAMRRTRAGTGASAAVHLLSGPEGGLTAAEERSARAAGWQALTLGPRTLRAETAPLATLSALVLDAY